MMALTAVFWTTQDESRPLQQSAACLQLPSASATSIRTVDVNSAAINHIIGELLVMLPKHQLDRSKSKMPK